MTNEIALKPCPFCGETNIQSLKELDFVCCQDCGASLEDSEPSAREHWNTRDLPAQGEPVEADILGAGDAIFAECAEIALEHVGQCFVVRTLNGRHCGCYDAACRDIAEAIRTRSLNRKTMNAIADAAQGEQK